MNLGLFLGCVGCPTLGLGGWVLGWFVPAGLKRYYGQGDLHFITFSCYRRLPLLASRRARDLFVRELVRVRREYQFKLVGYVVMPEHVHLLISEAPENKTAMALQMLKQRVSRKMRKKRRNAKVGQLRLGFGDETKSCGVFGRRGRHDFNVYTRWKVREKLLYMHQNPVRRGLVLDPKDWPWSSFRFYATGKEGLVPIDVVPEWSRRVDHEIKWRER